MLLPTNLLIGVYCCIWLNAKWTVLVVSIIEVIAFIVIIVYDILVITVVPDDYHVPVSQESYKEPRDEPAACTEHTLYVLCII
jgi:hypothetical protein